jgi:hypothetical protein
VIALVAALALSACGSERWAQKTLTDPAAVAVHSDSFSDAAVINLRELTPPAKWSPSLPRLPGEKIVYRVRALLIGAKLEDGDEDIHIVIADRTDPTKTMIVEIPSAHCVEKTPEPFRSEIIAARKAFLTKMRVKAAFTTLPKPLPIEVIGVGFFDKLHGQTGVAPNAGELHPVLRVRWPRDG